MPDRRLSRRSFLGRTAALGGAVALSRLGWPELSGPAGAARPRPIRPPGSLPHPKLPAGTDTLPKIDHIVVVMMENHSFDNYLGMLARHGGNPKTDGFAFDAHGAPANRQPYKDGYVVPVHAQSMCQPPDVDQTWNGTHFQIDGGKMDGFARNKPGSMLYWDESDIPFYYSLAKTFTVGNRWFCSAPCQTFPNRRFLLAATAEGLI